MENEYFSGWRKVYSGIPQGLVLRPLVFLIYINDLDLGVRGTISKFTDDTKLVNCDEDSEELQKNIDKLVERADRWQMKFSAEKCEAMHFGRKNLERQYKIRGKIREGCRSRGA